MAETEVRFIVMEQVTPCVNQPAGLTILAICLGALNVALNTWLVNRRLAADSRERNGNGKRVVQHGPRRQDETDAEMRRRISEEP